MAKEKVRAARSVEILQFFRAVDFKVSDDVISSLIFKKQGADKGLKITQSAMKELLEMLAGSPEKKSLDAVVSKMKFPKKGALAISRADLAKGKQIKIADNGSVVLSGVAKWFNVDAKNTPQMASVAFVDASTGDRRAPAQIIITLAKA
jgi:hypothetical protein